jgi:hypothetical protein
LFFAPGDPIFDAIISNSLSCNRGRSCAFKAVGPFDYSGFVFVFNIEPNITILVENGINIKDLSLFRRFLPLEQIYIFYPLNEASKEVTEDELKEFLKQHWNIRRAIHLGQRSGYKNNSSLMQKFINSYPHEAWQNLVKFAYKKCREQALNTAKEYADIKAAKREMDRIINGYIAESLYFGRDDEMINIKKETYKLVYEAINKPYLNVDSIAYMRVVKDERL